MTFRVTVLQLPFYELVSQAQKFPDRILSGNCQERDLHTRELSPSIQKFHKSKILTIKVAGQELL